MGYGIFYSHLTKEAARRGCPQEEILAKAREMGVDRLTLDAEQLAEIRPIAEQASMGFNIIYCISRLVHGEELDKTLKAAEDTAAAGGKILMLVPGFYENGLTDPEAVRNAAPLMKEVVRVGNSLGIHVAIEDYGGLFTPYSTVSQIKTMLDAVDGLKFVYDSGNLLYHRQDAIALWDATADRIVGIHGKDLTDKPVDGTEPVLTPAGDILYPTTLGKGLLPGEEIRRRIREKNIPPERITFEHDGGGAPDTMAFLRDCVAFMEG